MPFYLLSVSGKSRVNPFLCVCKKKRYSGSQLNSCMYKSERVQTQTNRLILIGLHVKRMKTCSLV